jgi:hypothetical protein
MRTTVELPPDLLRAAKARAAERGEALKALFVRAVSRELGRSPSGAREEHVAWPLISSRRKGAVRLTNDDLARIDAAEEAGAVAVARRHRP